MKTDSQKPLVVLLAACVLLIVAGLFETPTPPPIKVRPLTEQQISQELRNEQRAKRIQRASKVAAQVFKALGCKKTFADATGEIADEFGLSPRLLAALVFVESSCNPNARDSKGCGSIGLMQVNSRVWHRSEAELRDPERNLRMGARILKADIQKYGLVEGLHAYNGFGEPSEKYAIKVLTAAGMSASIPKG